MKKEKSRSYQAMAEELRMRLGSREYVLGIDPGVGSIGIAAVALDEVKPGEFQASDIIYACSRIFLSSESSSDRKEKRAKRNTTRHKKNRLIVLWKKLAERGLMLPFCADGCSDTSVLRFEENVRNADPYVLRARGICSELTLSEMGRAVYHIATHRGASTVRTFTDDEKDERDIRREEDCSLTNEICRVHGVDTFIEVISIYNRYYGEGYRNGAERSNSNTPLPIPTRDIIENETRKLFETQRIHHPELDDAYLEEVWNLMFYENPGLIPEFDRCPYFPEEQRAPKALFLNEERRLWEAINNIRVRKVLLVDGHVRFISEPLEDGERKMLYEDLRKGKTLTEAGFKNKLPHYKSCDIVLQGPDRERQQIEGFRFRNVEDAAFFSNFTDAEKDEFITLFVTVRDNRILEDRLITELDMSEDDVSFAIANFKLLGGSAPIGRKALRIILDKIISDGVTYHEAEAQALAEGLLPDISSDKVYDHLPYYGEAVPSCTCALDGKAWHSSNSLRAGTPSFIKPNCNADEEKYGRIRNSVVHQTLNELRKIVNEIIDIFGKKPYHITVELARELKESKKEKIRASMENARRNNENRRIFEKYCKPNNLPEKYVRVFRLLEMQNWTCPYCLEKISVEDVVCGRVDLDHIFPIEETSDSSDNNIVACDKHCNEVLKRMRIPFSAFGHDSVLWSRITDFLDRTPALSEKKWRFEMHEDEYREYLESNGFLSRFKGDNAYAAKVMCEYLRCLYPVERKFSAVSTLKGSETALLRRSWNLNGITRELGRVLSQDSSDKDDYGKDRTDARHHALDAIVAAYYTESYKMQLNSLSSAGMPLKTIISRIALPACFRSMEGLTREERRAEFRRSIEYFLCNKTYVSRKIDTSSNGSLLKDTEYKVIEANEEDVLLFTKKLVSGIKADTFFGSNAKSVEGILKVSIPDWLSEENKEKMSKMAEANEAVFNRILDCRVKAEAEMNAEQIRKGLDPTPLREKAVVAKALHMAGGKYRCFMPRKRNKVVIKENGGSPSAFDTGDNHCLDLYRDETGVLQGEILRKVNVNRKGWKPEYVRKGYDFVQRIYIKDILEVDSLDLTQVKTKGDKTRTIRTNNAPTGRTFISICTFTESGSGIQVYYTSLNSEELLRSGSFRVKGISRLNARKVVLSPAGLIQYRSEILRNHDRNEEGD